MIDDTGYSSACRIKSAKNTFRFVVNKNEIGLFTTMVIDLIFDWFFNYTIYFFLNI